jgi:hypothetical protein
VNTHFPDGTEVEAPLILLALAALALAGGFGAGLAGLFFRALRAAARGAALLRTGAEAFDFAAVFFVFATALAMTYKQSAKEGRDGALHHFERFRARREADSTLQMQPTEQPETDQTVENQEDRNDQIEQPRHDQNKQTRNHRNDR